jgi:thiamine-phosphate pyrophosphorylase
VSTPARVRRPLPRLYVICDAEVCGRAEWTLVDFASACLDAGVRLLQIRGKNQSARALLDATLAVVDRAARSGALIIVNDRPDIARLAGAAGVHVGQDDLPAEAARAIVGREAMVGLSTHTSEEYERALDAPIDYVAIGPVFPTATKGAGREAVGLARLGAAARRAAPLGLPVVAIGGVTLERAPSVIDAGARSVAVVSDLFTGGDPAVRVAQFVRTLG